MAAMNVLMLAANFAAPYRVLRCAAAIPAAVPPKVHVLGTGAAAPLQLSRFCTSFRHFALDEALPQIRAAVAAHAIDLVIPSDRETTELLCRIGGGIGATLFPLPAPEVFRALVDKDRFAEFCRARGLPHPRTVSYASSAAARAALDAGAFALPAMAKAVDCAGGTGIVTLTRETYREVLAGFAHAPLLLQEFIDGEDVSLTAFCRGGRIERQFVYTHPGGVFRLLRLTEFEALVARIVCDENISGVVNFDARIDRSGKSWLIECNPRFFFNMDVALAAGINFTDPYAAPAPTPAGYSIAAPTGLVRNLRRGRLPSVLDLKLLAFWLADPLIFARVASGVHRPPSRRPAPAVLIPGEAA